jgi:hypothetical protein
LTGGVECADSGVGSLTDKTKRFEMSASDDIEEQIKWLDTLDVLESASGFERGLEMARECTHPDARWLCALLPPGITANVVAQIMLAQGNTDPRALFFFWLFENTAPTDVGSRSEALVREQAFVRHRSEALVRSAEQGYARAQKVLGELLRDEGDQEATRWFHRASKQGERTCMFELADLLTGSHGVPGVCVNSRGLLLLQKAAELGDVRAQFWYGYRGFRVTEWERYHWMAKAALRDPVRFEFDYDIIGLLGKRRDSPKGSRVRMLFEVGPVCRVLLDPRNCDRFYRSEERKEELYYVMDLYDAIRSRMRDALDCWSMEMRRKKYLVKDMRLLIGQMAWREPWQWAEQIEANEAGGKRASQGSDHRF